MLGSLIAATIHCAILSELALLDDLSVRVVQRALAWRSSSRACADSARAADSCVCARRRYSGSSGRTSLTAWPAGERNLRRCQGYEHQQTSFGECLHVIAPLAKARLRTWIRIRQGACKRRAIACEQGADDNVAEPNARYRVTVAPGASVGEIGVVGELAGASGGVPGVAGTTWVEPSRDDRSSSASLARCCSIAEMLRLCCARSMPN